MRGGSRCSADFDCLDPRHFFGVLRKAADFELQRPRYLTCSGHSNRSHYKRAEDKGEGFVSIRQPIQNCSARLAFSLAAFQVFQPALRYSDGFGAKVGKADGEAAGLRNEPCATGAQLGRVRWRPGSWQARRHIDINLCEPKEMDPANGRR